MKSTPPKSPVRPKVRRGRPEKASIPGVEISSPRKVPIRAFNTDPPVRPAMVQRPMSMRAKYSGGPNERANFTSGIDSSIRNTTLAVPAMKEPMAAMPRAFPARPCRAIW